MKKRQMVKEAVNNLKGLLNKNQLEAFEVELARRLDGSVLDKKVELNEIKLHLVGIEQNSESLKDFILKTFKYLFEGEIVSFSEINSKFYVIDLNGGSAYQVFYVQNDDIQEIIEIKEV